MKTLSNLKAAALQNPEVADEYRKLSEMTLDTLRKERGLSWQQVSYQLSALTRGKYGEDYLHPHRLWRLRKGRTDARGYEIRALLEWSGGEVDSYKE